MKPELLLVRPIYGPAMAELERDFTVHKPWTAPDPRAYARQSCGAVRVAVTTTALGFSRAEIEALPKLEILGCYGPYVDLVDTAAAKERGVAVTHTPDSTAEPVADLAMGMLVAVMRRICEADRFVRAGKWPTSVLEAGREVRGKTCGIVGFGRIGREIAARATAFGMRIRYHGPRLKDGVVWPYHADVLSLAKESDVLVVTCRLTPETRNLVDAPVLDALGKDGYLVNVARGAIVDEDALVAALESGRIAGAALDVFRDEPQVPAALMKMDNVVLAPHMGTSTREIRDERSRKLLTDLRAFFAGRSLQYEVTSDG
jgi:lactate dehydrogenase-like 2-hydroxyacid dehydrogenase